MTCDCRRIQFVQSCHYADQRKGDERQNERQYNSRPKGRKQVGINPAIAHSGTTLEPNGQQQIDGHYLGCAFRDRQITFGKGRDQAENEKQYCRRKEITRYGGE